MSQRRFAQEFEDEAVRLGLTSGRTQREIAGDLGIGLSTLVRWNGRSRDRQAKAFGRQTEPDIAAELKRLRPIKAASTISSETSRRTVRRSCSTVQLSSVVRFSTRTTSPQSWAGRIRRMVGNHLSSRARIPSS
jgi:transposase